MSKLSVFVKGTVIATVIVLAFSSVALTNAFAKSPAHKAPAAAATTSQVSAKSIQLSWKDELAWLNFDNTILARVDRALDGIVVRFDKIFRSKRAEDRLSGRMDLVLKETQSLLSQAQSIVKAHAGFDASGNVTDQAQALKSVETLGAILNQLRGTLIYQLEHVL